MGTYPATVVVLVNGGIIHLKDGYAHRRPRRIPTGNGKTIQARRAHRAGSKDNMVGIILATRVAVQIHNRNIGGIVPVEIPIQHRTRHHICFAVWQDTCVFQRLNSSKWIKPTIKLHISYQHKAIYPASIRMVLEIGSTVKWLILALGHKNTNRKTDEKG